MPVDPQPLPPPRRRRFGGGSVLLLVLAAVVVTALATTWFVKSRLFPDEFRPVVLAAAEEQRLEEKMDALEPEPYSESDEDRVVRFTERELNALLAKNTDLAERVAIDLAADLVSAKILVPLDEDFPVLGGKTVRVKTGVELGTEDGRAVVRVRGLSVMGVPLPNAWIGGIKNVDLVEEMGGDGGFWKAFADGVAEMRIEDGELVVRLEE